MIMKLKKNFGIYTMRIRPIKGLKIFQLEFVVNFCQKTCTFLNNNFNYLYTTSIFYFTK